MAEDYEVLDSSGYTSTIYWLPGDPPRACKSFNSDCINTHFPVELEAYRRFSANNHPPSILKFYGVHDKIQAGIILEYVEGDNLHEHTWKREQGLTPAPKPEILYRWASQAAEALEFAHSVGVFNSDIHVINCFLDKDLNLKVGDWAGASIDGSISHSSYRLRHRLQYSDGRDVARVTGITAITEVFALGTALYVMVSGENPWPELREPKDRDEIKRRIAKKEFPDTKVLPVLGDIVSKCWHVEFKTMTEVKLAIEAERTRWTKTVTNDAKPPSLTV